ncbi:hypothetical protein SRHO_G00118620 [Serrasalmus rhombeus]
MQFVLDGFLTQRFDMTYVEDFKFEECQKPTLTPRGCKSVQEIKFFALTDVEGNNTETKQEMELVSHCGPADPLPSIFPLFSFIVFELLKLPAFDTLMVVKGQVLLVSNRLYKSVVLMGNTLKCPMPPKLQTANKELEVETRACRLDLSSLNPKLLKEGQHVVIIGEVLILHISEILEEDQMARSSTAQSSP